MHYLSEQNARSLTGYLPVFQPPGGTLSELPLGTVEIPLSKIKGTFAEGRRQAFAGNYMPLLKEKSEFAAKWAGVNSIHLREGLRDPIKAYEYMGFVYVSEGNKRVSVLHYHRAYSVRAELTRLMPERDPNREENAVFYEFIDKDRRYLFRHLWFSRAGRYSGLLARAEEYARGRAELESSWLDFDFFRFREAYHELGYGELPITTGDAFWAYVQLYGFPNDVSDPELRARVKHCEPQFHYAALPEETKSDAPLQEKRTALFSLFAKTSSLSLCFALAGTPENNSFAHKHDVGRRILRLSHQVSMEAASGLPKGEDAYPALRALAEKRPDILFLTDPSWDWPAARLTLDYPDCMVLHCSAEKPKFPQATYYGFTAMPAFLAGVLAGCLTRTGTVGYMEPDAESGALPADAHAFANGARLVHAHTRVLRPDPACQDAEALRRMAEHRADICWRPVRGLAGHRAFVGLYAQLCSLSPEGRAEEIYAGACWNWDVFYKTLTDRILQGSPEPLAIAYAENNVQMQQAGGLLEICTIPRTLGRNPARLLRIFAELAEDPQSIPYKLLLEEAELETV